jgi:Fic family protein
LDAKDFTSKEAGRLVRTVKGHIAFVPAPLPPALEFPKDLVFLLSKADTALAELSASGKHLPNPHLLIAPYVRREAVLSSRIEGTRASLTDLLLDEIGDGSPARPGQHGDLEEVRNYVRALEYGLGRLSDLPLSLRLVRELHERLMQGVRGGMKTPGEFRTGQNIVGSKGHDEASAPYVPPPVTEMHQCLQEWEQYLNADDGLPPLVQCGLMHVQFESIHPFWDGNGRVGRLLITLFLISKEKLSQPLLYLSAYIEEHRHDYYDLLQQTRTRSGWVNWLRFFLTGVIEIATEAGKQAARLLELRESYRAQTIGRPRALALIDHLLTNPYITVPRATRLLSVSQPTARSAVLALQQLGVIQETTRRVWGRIYVAPEIMAAIDVKPPLRT